MGADAQAAGPLKMLGCGVTGKARIFGPARPEFELQGLYSLPLDAVEILPLGAVVAVSDCWGNFAFAGVARPGWLS